MFRYGWVCAFLVLLSVEANARPRQQPPVPSTNLVLPDKMQLSGGERREEISTDIGKIELRWERSIERFFVRTPERAVSEVARIVRRVLSSGIFPPSFSNFSLQWNIVFFDEHIPSGQIPLTILNGCHPGWMVGHGERADIYIRARALASGCDGSDKKDNSIAEVALIQVLLHEFGHGIEHYLLDNAIPHDRLRSEGFATWFEQYASSYSSDLNKKDILKRLKELSRYKIKNSPELSHFDGTAADYAYAAMVFLAIEERFGIRRMLELYQVMRRQNLPFLAAIQSRYDWNAERVMSEVDKLIK